MVGIRRSTCVLLHKLTESVSKNVGWNIYTVVLAVLRGGVAQLVGDGSSVCEISCDSDASAPVDGVHPFVAAFDQQFAEQQFLNPPHLSEHCSPNTAPLFSTALEAYST